MYPMRIVLLTVAMFTAGVGAGIGVERYRHPMISPWYAVQAQMPEVGCGLTGAEHDFMMFWTSRADKVCLHQEIGADGRYLQTTVYLRQGDLIIPAHAK